MQVDRSGYIVKSEAAKKQIAEDAARKARETKTDQGGQTTPPDTGALGEQDGGFGQAGDTGNDGGGTGTEGGDQEQTPKPKRFFMSAELDYTRINRDMDKIITEILNHISEDGSLKISLEVHAEAPEGFNEQTVRAPKENCSILKIKNFGFENE